MARKDDIMALVTRTINPLHFEDMEPHRFEDLARQLVYDFREWSNIEATGTAGSDDGFDIRARETFYDYDDEDEGNGPKTTIEERIWLIQCKREQKIGPKRIINYLDGIFDGLQEQIHGIIFIASCNFSKKARDAFIQQIREHGIREFQIWGRSELEDLLFQPKNDHLLFAYFGISLKVRRLAIKTQIRSRLAMKRKAIKVLSTNKYQSVLVRDASDKCYPWKEDIPNFNKSPRWRVLEFRDFTHAGIELCAVKNRAYLADNMKHFDYLRLPNLVQEGSDPWSKRHEEGNRISEAHRYWYDLPNQNQAYFEVSGVISYDSIVAIDEHGDDFFKGPHIYVLFNDTSLPFLPMYNQGIVTNCEYPDCKKVPANKKNKRTLFPKHIAESIGPIDKNEK